MMIMFLSPKKIRDGTFRRVLCKSWAGGGGGGGV